MKIGDRVEYHGQAGTIGRWLGPLDGYNVPIDLPGRLHMIVPAYMVKPLATSHLGQRC